jgi:hypothetical protein
MDEFGNFNDDEDEEEESPFGDRFKSFEDFESFLENIGDEAKKREEEIHVFKFNPNIDMGLLIHGMMYARIFQN